MFCRNRIVILISEVFVCVGLLLIFNSEAYSMASEPVKMNEVNCDIVVVGGGVGGFAAAMQACEMAGEFGIKKIIVTEQTDWLGGQFTSQGVTAADDNDTVILGGYTTGASELYIRLYETIRDIYRPRALEVAKKTKRLGAADSKARQMEISRIKGMGFTPGNPWSGRMGFLPADCVKAMEAMLKPYIDSGLLSIYYDVLPVEVIKGTEENPNKVTAVKVLNEKTGEELLINAKMTIDATDLGDLLPMSGTAFRTGIEASVDTMEPTLFDREGNELYPEALPDCVQTFTYTFAVEWGALGEDNRRPWESRPKSYEVNRHRFEIRKEGGADVSSWWMFGRWNEFGKADQWGKDKDGVLPWRPSFWTYRQMLDAMYVDADLDADLYPRFVNGEWKTEFDIEEDPGYFTAGYDSMNVGDIIEVNWASNDYAGENIIGASRDEQKEIFQRARELSLGFMYWMWYEAPRDPEDVRLDPRDEENWSIDPVTGKNRGYSNLKFRADVMGTEDGLSKFPYIRESRRIRAVKTILQQEIMGPHSKRSKLYHDTVGIGQYFMDVHRCDMGQDEKRDVDYKSTIYEDGSEGGEQVQSKSQIPFGALIPEKTDSLLAGCKNIGTTHITSAAYRLHPVEFQIGQAAGAAAVLSLYWDIQPRQMWAKEAFVEKPNIAEKRLRRLQYELLKSKVPLYWNSDCGWDTEWFAAVQFVCALEIMRPSGMAFEPEKLLTKTEAEAAAAKLGDGEWFLKAIEGKEITRGVAAKILYNEFVRRFGLTEQ